MPVRNGHWEVDDSSKSFAAENNNQQIKSRSRVQTEFYDFAQPLSFSELFFPNSFFLDANQSVNQPIKNKSIHQASSNQKDFKNPTIPHKNNFSLTKTTISCKNNSISCKNNYFQKLFLLIQSRRLATQPQPESEK